MNIVLMVDTNVSKRIFEAVIDAYPDHGVIVGVNLRSGQQNGAVMVDVFTGRERTSGLPVDARSRERLRSAIRQALHNHRCDVLVLEVEA